MEVRRRRAVCRGLSARMIGCTEPLPYSIRCLGEQWEKTYGDTDDLAKIIKEIEPNADVEVHPPGKCGIMGSWHFGMVCVSLGRRLPVRKDLEFREFNYRLLKFRPIK